MTRLLNWKNWRKNAGKLPENIDLIQPGDVVTEKGMTQDETATGIETEMIVAMLTRGGEAGNLFRSQKESK